MSESFTFGTPGNATELESLKAILSHTFNIAAENREAAFERIGEANVRCVRAGGQVAGGLGLVPMGQYFGGRSVPMTGIALVGVSPARRGGGAGSALMKHTVRELHEHGVALSALYPATQPIYRSAGYELAGSLYRVTLRLKQMSGRERSPNVRELTPDDASTVQSLYARFASMHNGVLDRGPYIWTRVRHPLMQPATGYLVERDGNLEGYLYYFNHKTSLWEFDLIVSDIIALTPEAARRLLALLANHRSMSEHAKLLRPPNDPMLIELPERCYEIAHDIAWMLRVTHVENALTARGYPRSARGEVHFEIDDDVIQSNAGNYVLRVENGEAHASRGGKGSMQLDVRSLAMLYSGFLTPTQLRAAGRMRASDDDVSLLTAFFAGPSPWMGDMF